MGHECSQCFQFYSYAGIYSWYPRPASRHILSFVTNFHVYEDKVDQLKEIVENNKVEDYDSKYYCQYSLNSSLKAFDRGIKLVFKFEEELRNGKFKGDIEEYFKWNFYKDENSALWRDWCLVFYKHAFPTEKVEFENPYLNDLFSK